MSFDVSPRAYTRFMGRYSEPLAVLFADLARVRRGQRTLDVRRAEAERLRFGDGVFDVTLAQLVVHFMSDAVAGVG